MNTKQDRSLTWRFMELSWVDQLIFEHPADLNRQDQIDRDLQCYSIELCCWKERESQLSADWWFASTSKSYCQIEHQRQLFLQSMYQLVLDVSVASRLIKTQLIEDFQCFWLWYLPASFRESFEYSNAKTARTICRLQRIPKLLEWHCSSELLGKHTFHLVYYLKLTFQKQVPKYLQELHLRVWRQSFRAVFTMSLLLGDNLSMERSESNAERILKDDGVP